MQKETLLDIAMMHADTLVDKAREGNREAQGRLVSLWYKRIYNFAWKYFNNHDQASEAAQLTFISMYRNMGQLATSSSFKPWLYRIATNACHEEARKSSRLQSFFEDPDSGLKEEIPTEHVGDNPEAKYMSLELSDQLVFILNKLPHEQKTVVVMKEFEGLKFREIAEVLDVSENTVKSRLYYGLAQLKKLIELHQIDLKLS